MADDDENVIRLGPNPLGQKPGVKRSRRRAATGGIQRAGYEGRQAEPRQQIAEPGNPDDEADRRPVKRVTMGKRWAELTRRIANGEITWEDVAATMDDDELANYQFQSKRGDFTGRPPSYLPRGFILACDSALAARGRVNWKSVYPTAVQEIARIALFSEKDADRLKALDMIVQRIEGKVADRLVLQSSSQDPWDEIIAGVVAEASEEDAIARAHDYAARMSDDDQG